MVPDANGQSPRNTLNKLDLPQPFSPVTITLLPRGTLKLRSLTNKVPSGFYIQKHDEKRVHHPVLSEEDSQDQRVN